jgi:hypothetical protein
MEGDNMQCPKCQFENREGVKFCEECGAEFGLECPVCKANIPLGRKFCGECGHKIDFPVETPPKDLSFDEKLTKIQKYLPKGLTEKILSQRDRIEGERKQVTVMFADMEGFTSLSERLGPEEAYTIMDQVYEILIHKVHDYEGTVVWCSYCTGRCSSASDPLSLCHPPGDDQIQGKDETGETKYSSD